MQENSNISSVLEIINIFNNAFNNHNIEEVMTDDCVFEITFPAPDGKHIEGQSAVRETFSDFFNSSPKAVFESEDIFGCGVRATVRWLYRWDGESGQGHVRGVDVFRIRDGKISEKPSYVKG